MKKVSELFKPTLLAASVIILFGCKKEVEIPPLSTVSVSMISLTEATSGGIVSSEGGSEAIARRVCWNTTHNPDISGHITADGNGSGTYSSKISDLIPNTHYCVRAYATNRCIKITDNKINIKLIVSD